MWTCPKCQTKVDPSLEVCWNCGTATDGTEDPTFVKADDAGPIDDDPVVPELGIGKKLGVETDLPEPIAGELVEAYDALDLMEATFLADQLNQAGIMALSDTHDMHDTLGTMEGSPKVWVKADDLAKARSWLANYESKKASSSGD